jgi:ATP-dependent Clp protease ATP-binding subunit ClpA
MPRYTQRAELVFRSATDAARKFGHPEVHPVHILLGLFQEAGGIPANVLKNRGFSLAQIESAILQFDFAEAVVLPADLPWTKQAQLVSQHAAAEALVLDHNYVGTEHILLSMTRLSPYQWLRLVSSNELEDIRKDVLAVLGYGEEQPSQKKPKKGLAHVVLLNHIVHAAIGSTMTTPEGLMCAAALATYCHLLQSIHIPKPELPCIIDALGEIRLKFPFAQLLVLVDELKKDLQEA